MTTSTEYTATAFIHSLYAPGDFVCIRPIEVWTETGKKKSRVDYKGIRYLRVGKEEHTTSVIEAVKQRAAEMMTNVFFGVCPRFGDREHFDKAWQVRIVRGLWADVDTCKPEEALPNIKAAGLPDPSISISTGRGGQFYWLFDSPFLIDDAADPLPVMQEWLEQEGKEKKFKREFIIQPETNRRLYLDQPQNAQELTTKAQFIQDVAAGIASVIGGDHTHDLSRLLRLPGTMNRKDEKNGRKPIPCEIVEFHPTRLYPFAIFAPRAAKSPNKVEREKVASICLPEPRKLGQKAKDTLQELIAISNVAPIGTRSGVDWNLVCFAIERGIERAELWNMVQGVGKFAEGKEQYFAKTWDKAAGHTRQKIYDKLVQKASGQMEPKSSKSAVLEAAIAASATASGRPVVVITPTEQPVADLLEQTTDVVLSTSALYVRADHPVAVRNQDILVIDRPEQLAGVLNQHCEFIVESNDGKQFLPLPTKYGQTWLHNPAQASRLPKISLFTKNPVYTEDWRLTPPGYDKVSGIYYAGEEVKPLAGTEHLDALLWDFCFKHPCDRTNYLGMLLTIPLVSHFIGSKPALLLTANQPDLGKSILAQIVAILRDGRPVETVSYNPNDEEFEKSLGAIIKLGITTPIVDNAKSRGGKVPMIESACLERNITAPIVSFRLLGASSIIRCENSHIFCITANTPNVSRDLVTRSLPVYLHYEGNPDHRQFTMADPEGYAQQFRAELLGELIGMVERWKTAGMPLAKTHSRFNKLGWGNIIGGILMAAGEPDFLLNADEAPARWTPPALSSKNLWRSWPTTSKATGPAQGWLTWPSSISCLPMIWAMAPNVQKRLEWESSLVDL